MVPPHLLQRMKLVLHFKALEPNRLGIKPNQVPSAGVEPATPWFEAKCSIL